MYLRKEIGADMIESIAKFQSEHQKHGGGEYRLIRVKATIRPTADTFDLQWDMMELLDWQFLKQDRTGWQPWAVESERAREQKVRDDAAAAAAKAAQEQKARRATAKAAAEAAKWRTWTDASGEHKIEAKFGGLASGEVVLIKRDGSKVQIPIEKLSDDDQEWVNNRRR